MNNRTKTSGRYLSALVAAFLFTLSGTVFGADDYSQWASSATITLNTSSTGANIAGNVSKFPILIRLNPSNFPGFGSTLPGGADIRFAKTDGTHLPYQIERWVDGSNNADTAEIWVLVDVVYGNNASQTFKMFWGKSNAVDSSNGNSVFDPANGFTGVWHLNKDYLNSASNSYNGNGSTKDAAGMIGRGRKFNGANRDSIQIPGLLGSPATLTFSAWVKVDSIDGGSNDASIFSMGENVCLRDSRTGGDGGNDSLKCTYYYLPNATWHACNVPYATGKLLNQGWKYVAFVCNPAGSSQIAYINGESVRTTTFTNAIDYSSNGANTLLGTRATAGTGDDFGGVIDEPRLDKVVRSADWIKLCYENQQAAQTLVAIACTNAAPTILTQPVSQTVNAGQSVTFTVAASGNPAPAYQWQKNGTAISGATGTSYTIAAAAAGDAATYAVVVSNSQGSVTSNNAVLTVSSGTGTMPAIVSQPMSQTKVIGQSVTFAVMASGIPAPTYQWQKNNSSISGATGSSYSIAAISSGDAGTYAVVVQNAQGSVTSAPAVLTLAAKAIFKASPAAGKIPLSVTFTDSSTGTIGKRYWYFGDGSGIDSSIGPTHVYSTEGGFTAKLVILDPTGSRADSMSTSIRTYNDNPVLISGRFAGPAKVEITFDNYGVLPTGPLPPYADSIALWYMPGQIPLSGLGATYAKIYLPSAMQSSGKGASVKDTISLPQPLADTVYGFVTAVHWSDGSWSKFAKGNGCNVLVKDTNTPVNACGIYGRYLGSDSAALIAYNLKALDTTAVDSFALWYSATETDSVPDFTNAAASKWYDLKKEYATIAASGRDSAIVVNALFNVGVVKSVWCAVVVKGKNDNCSKSVKSRFSVGVDRPSNPIALTAKALSASRVFLSWPPVVGPEAIRIAYRANAAIPVGTPYFDSTQYDVAMPGVADTGIQITGLQEKTRYYFGAQIYRSGQWSDFTPQSCATDSTCEAIAALSANRVKLNGLAFDSVLDQIKVTYGVAGAAAQDSLQVGIAYSIGGYSSSDSLAQQVVSVNSAGDTAVAIKLRENLRFNTRYYISLWERHTDGKWTPPTDSSRDTVGTPNYNWQAVKYFTKVGGDTAFAFNNTIRIVTDSVAVDGVVGISDKVVFWQPDSSLFAGFVPASIAFRFAQPQASAKLYVGLHYNPLPGTYPASDLRVYRFQDSVWTAESSVVVDSKSGYVSVRTNDLSAPFMVLLDTVPVSVMSESHADIVPEQAVLSDTFEIRDNSANVKWQFLCAKGSDAFAAGGQITNGSLGYTRSGLVAVHLPQAYVTGDNGVRAKFIVTDGVHTTVTDVSRRVKRLKSDYVRTEPMKWLPLRVTSQLDSPQVRFALRALSDGATPWTYDTKKVRLFKWYPNAQNATSARKWVEYSDKVADVFSFKSGGLTWIKTRDAVEVDFGAGVTQPLQASYPVSVTANDWTDIALPFKFNVKIGDILDSTFKGTLNADSLQIYAWERDSTGMFWAQPVYIADLAVAGLADKTSTLGCLDLMGYSVFNPTAEDITVRVPPIPESMSHYGQVLGKKSLGKKSLAGWAVKICSAVQGGPSLTDVYCGYDPSKGAAMRYYLLSPSFCQMYTGVYDADRKKVFGNALTGALTDGGCAFKLAFVNESSSLQRIVYRVENAGAMSAAMKAKIYNEETACYEDAQTPVTVAAGTTQFRWLFVGNDGYLAKAPVMNTAVLRLVGTYPNPFVRSVHIRYSLPASGMSSLKFSISDLRGAVLWQKTVPCQGSAGTSELIWNAVTQRGQKAAAGMYVLKMTAIDAKQQAGGIFERKITLLP